MRYHDGRLESSAHTKRVCLAAATHLCESAHAAGASPVWAQLSSCETDLPAIEELVRRPAWGPYDQPRQKSFVVPRVVVAPPPAPVLPSACSHSSASSSSSDSTADPPAEELAEMDQMHWIAPSKSNLIHFLRDATSLTLLCIARPLGSTFTTGVSISSAAVLGRSWCRRCLALSKDTEYAADLLAKSAK